MENIIEFVSCIVRKYGKRNNAANREKIQCRYNIIIFGVYGQENLIWKI